MEDGLLSLKWNNHKSTFFHILSNLRKRESYTDATIACEGRFFPVHKLVMSTCSDYFSDIFQRTTCKAPVVILKDIGYQEIEALLDYMYLGEVDVKQSELAGLIKAAECLRIKGLAVPDEDPNTSTPKRSTHIPECRSSPSAKRHRRDSDSSDDPHYYSHSKGQRSHSPLNQSSASSRSQSTSSTPVPSQTTEIETLAIVPSQSMPPPSYSESRRTTHQSSSSSHSLSISEPLGQEDNSGVAFIKVEVDDEKGNKSKDKSHKSLHISTRDNSRGEGGVCRDEGNAQEKNSLSNNYSEYCNNEADIDKEEQEQMGVFNGSEIPGPSGVQSASQLMGWGEEEGPFPHNLFGSEDGSHQQVCIATMDPELVAVRMFQGTKTQVQQIGFHQLQRIQGDEAALLQLTQGSGPTKVFIVQEPMLHTQSVEMSQKYSRPPILKKTSNRHVRRRQPQAHLAVQIDDSHSSTGESANAGGTIVQIQQLHPHVENTSMQPIQIINSESIKIDKKEVDRINSIEVRRNEEPPKFHQLQNLDEQVLHIPEKMWKVTSVEKNVQIDTKPLITQQTSQQSLSQPNVSIEETQLSTTSSITTSPQDLSARTGRCHECSYCNYTSRSKVDLSKHIRTHTKEKPYKCHICKYETGDRSNYRRHLAGVHKIKDSDLPAILQSPRQLQQSDCQHAQPQQEIVEMTTEEQMATNPLSMSVQTIEVLSMPFSEDQCQSTSASSHTS